MTIAGRSPACGRSSWRCTTGLEAARPPPGIIRPTRGEWQVAATDRAAAPAHATGTAGPCARPPAAAGGRFPAWAWMAAWLAAALHLVLSLHLPVTVLADTRHDDA